MYQFQDHNPCSRGGDVTDGLLDYLSGLFTHDIDRMDPHSNIKEDKDTSEEVKAMGGFGKALAEKERENGREDVIIDMLKKGNSPEAISDFCGYALSFVKEIQKKMENAAVLA